MQNSKLELQEIRKAIFVNPSLPILSLFFAIVCGGPKIRDLSGSLFLTLILSMNLIRNSMSLFY